MNARYSISQYVVATLVAAAVLVLPVACEDDLGYRNVGGQPVAFKLTAPDAWHGGMSVDESAPTTHCTSVQALSGGGTQLYLHTVVADNPAIEKVAVSRGTPIKGTDDATAVEVFKETYPRFSLSGICYTDDSFDAETQKDWTANFAYNQYYKSDTGTPADGGKHLLWPSHGNVCFFAFAPTVDDFKVKSEDDGSLTLSTADYKGSPTLTYTVPTDVTKQVDLMTANTASPTTAPTGAVNLEFCHALTAVQIKCGKDMLVGTIKEVTIDKIYGKGTQVIGSKTWKLDENFPKATYTISQDIELSAGKDAPDQTHVPEGTPIAGTDTDNLTFMLLPQTLPADATMTIKFKDKATGTLRTLSAKIAGHTWTAGKIVTYSVSASSIHISDATVEFSKPNGAVIPYSGVWYDAKCTASSEVTQVGAETVKIIIPEKSVTLQYKFNDSGEDWKNCTEKDGNGLLVIPAQPAYTEINGKFTDKETEKGTEGNPFSLPTDKDYGGETANCYLVDKAGYYSLPLVYGNGNVSGGHDEGLIYFPNHNDERFTNKDITVYVGGDAVLLWQDAPDLIDSASVKIKDGNLVFRIRKQTLAQGNAVVAVRDNSTPKKILWSWHIWVTPYKSKFYSEFYTSTTTIGPTTGASTPETFEYDFAQYNLGWCDRHGHNPSRKFSLRAVIDMSAYGGKKDFVAEIGKEFELMEFKGSDAGDNTYYQWGRKDPMLGGIYNSNTPTYKYHKKGNKSSWDTVEFTMENKQVFNQYKEDKYDYSFCKNLGDMLDLSDDVSNGATIGYGIQHPYMFITNSRTTVPDVPISTATFNYRNHWHKPYAECSSEISYLNSDTHIMFNAWNATAKESGVSYESIYTEKLGGDGNPVKDKDGKTTITAINQDNLKKNAISVAKSVYDPCPPKFKVPPIDAFRGIAGAGKSGYLGLDNSPSFENNALTIKNDKSSITFPLTGVRNYALRTNEWKTVQPNSGKELTEETEEHKKFYESFYRQSLPAFKCLTYVSSATIAKSPKAENAYQLLIFIIDSRNKDTKGNPYTNCYTMSSNSYGCAVRPIRE